MASMRPSTASASEQNVHVETSPNGRYIRYNEVLGKGAYKTVYKAFDTEEALEVAWNKLHVDRLSQHDLEKVSNEVSLLRQVEHNNIIRFYDTWHGNEPNGNNSINFITEQMMSGTLKEYLKKAKAIKLKVIRRWCRNILEAIAYLHSRDPPIMHRDLKCDNIFINGHVGEVKIGDLGLSGVKDREKADSVIGTPEFMAPELYEESYTEKVDIYAFGMCLLEIVTMEYPYSECSNMAQIFRKVFSGEKPRAYNVLVDGDVKDVITACLRREASRPSAVDLLQHPLFNEWDKDDGKCSNLSLVKGSPEEIPGTADVNKSSTTMPIGTELIDWSDPLNRNVLVSIEEAEAGGTEDQQVSVVAAQDNGGFYIGLEIPIRDAIKRVEFTFDPFEDSSQHIAHEMVSEFGLGSEQLGVIREEIDRQVLMAREQREAASRNATPQPPVRDFHNVSEITSDGISASIDTEEQMVSILIANSSRPAQPTLPVSNSQSDYDASNGNPTSNTLPHVEQDTLSANVETEVVSASVEHAFHEPGLPEIPAVGMPVDQHPPLGARNVLDDDGFGVVSGNHFAEQSLTGSLEAAPELNMTQSAVVDGLDVASHTVESAIDVRAKLTQLETGRVDPAPEETSNVSFRDQGNAAVTPDPVNGRENVPADVLSQFTPMVDTSPPSVATTRSEVQGHGANSRHFLLPHGTQLLNAERSTSSGRSGLKVALESFRDQTGSHFVREPSEVVENGWSHSPEGREPTDPGTASRSIRQAEAEQDFVSIDHKEVRWNEPTIGTVESPISEAKPVLDHTRIETPVPGSVQLASNYEGSEELARSPAANNAQTPNSASQPTLLHMRTPDNGGIVAAQDQSLGDLASAIRPSSTNIPAIVVVGSERSGEHEAGRTRRRSYQSVLTPEAAVAEPRRQGGSEEMRVDPPVAGVGAGHPDISSGGTQMTVLLSSPERKSSASVVQQMSLSKVSTQTSPPRNRSARSSSWKSFHSSESVHSATPKSRTVAASVDKQDERWYTLCLKLMNLCAHGKYDDAVATLAGGASPTFADYDRRTPLHVSAAQGHATVCALLIEHGACIDARDRWGNTAILDAKEKDHIEVVELLKRHGAVLDDDSMDVIDLELMQFSAKGDVDSVRSKLSGGARANYADYDRRTPLHLACSEGHVTVAEVLLMNGASPNAEDRKGRTPLDDAISNGRRSILRLLRQYGASVPRHYYESDSELEVHRGMDLLWFSATGKLEEVKEAIDRGADPDFNGYDNRSALHLACAEGHRLVVEFLLECGASIKAHDRWGRTPSDDAVKAGREDIVDLLAKGGQQHPGEYVPKETSSQTVRERSFQDQSGVPSSETASVHFDELSEGIAHSVSMGAIPNINLSADDFAAKYPSPNGEAAPVDERFPAGSSQSPSSRTEEHLSVATQPQLLEGNFEQSVSPADELHAQQMPTSRSQSVLESSGLGSGLRGTAMDGTPGDEPQITIDHASLKAAAMMGAAADGEYHENAIKEKLGECLVGANTVPQTHTNDTVTRGPAEDQPHPVAVTETMSLIVPGSRTSNGHPDDIRSLVEGIVEAATAGK